MAGRVLVPPVRIYVLIALLLAVTPGCGRKSPPVPPGTLKPMPPKDVKYTITKDGVVLSWGVPIKNVDGSPIVGLKGFEVFKALEADNSCLECPRRFKNPVWIPFKGKLKRGITMAYEDRTLVRGGRYFYKVRTVKGLFSKSEFSNEVSFSWHPPPGAPIAIGVDRKDGVVEVKWRPPVYFEDGALIGQEELPRLVYKIFRRRINETNWRLLEEDYKLTHFIDRNVSSNEDYVYKIEPVYKFCETPIPGLEPLEMIAFEEQSKGEIAVPVELVAVPRKDGIELHWEAKLAEGQGFRVYRRGPEGLVEALNREPLRYNQFKDTTKLPKGTYTYWVTIVSSGPHPIEGAPSNRVKIEVD